MFSINSSWETYFNWTVHQFIPDYKRQKNRNFVNYHRVFEKYINKSLYPKQQINLKTMNLKFRSVITQGLKQYIIREICQHIAEPHVLPLLSVLIGRQDSNKNKNIPKYKALRSSKTFFTCARVIQ